MPQAADLPDLAHGFDDEAVVVGQEEDAARLARGW